MCVFQRSPVGLIDFHRSVQALYYTHINRTFRSNDQGLLRCCSVILFAECKRCTFWFRRYRTTDTHARCHSPIYVDESPRELRLVASAVIYLVCTIDLNDVSMASERQHSETVIALDQPTIVPKQNRTWQPHRSVCSNFRVTPDASACRLRCLLSCMC